MRTKAGLLCLLLALAAASAVGQEAARTANTADVYCSGMFTTEAVPDDVYVISGEDAHVRIAFTDGDYIYLSRGSAQGAKVGEEFLIMRPVTDPIKNKWFEWQPSLLRAMGQQWLDLGRVRIVVVHGNTSIARIIYSCDYMQRGDIALPFAERPAPPMKALGNFDRFAPASGKEEAMIVQSKDYRQAVGQDEIAYINMGANQGLKVGDYVRIFRYSGTRHETVYQTRGLAHEMWGFGKTPRPYKPTDLPREVLGEAIVIRVTPKAATVLVTYSLREMYLGDYVEIQ